MNIWRTHLRRLPLTVDGVHALYVNGLLRSLVFSLVGIFTPIYLYKLGISLWNDTRFAIAIVAGYYLVTRLTILITAMPLSRFMEKIGFRRSIGISIVLLVVNLALLLLSQITLLTVYFAAIVGGANVIFYWIARNSVISQDSHPKIVGNQMGMLLTLEHIATLIGPVAGGLIISRWGFSIMYIFCIFLLILSVIPLRYMPHHIHKNGASLRGFFQWLANRRYSHIALGVGGKSVDDYTIAVLWPLLIFLMGIDAGTVGGIFTLAAIGSLFVRLLLGKVFDAWHARKDYTDEFVFGISAVVTALGWLARLTVSTVMGIIFVDVGSGIFATAYKSLYMDYEQLGGMRMGSIAYWVYVEMIYSLISVLFMSTIIIGSFLGIWKELALVMAGSWVLVSIVMARESNMK